MSIVERLHIIIKTCTLKLSRDGDQGRVQVLLAQGVNPNAQDGVGRSPLMLSAMRGQEEVVISDGDRGTGRPRGTGPRPCHQHVAPAPAVT